jgi:transcriptional regulatory protein RtcR
MATFAAGGRVSVEIVQGEIQRLQSSWTRSGGNACDDLDELLGDAALSEIDLFDRVQLAEVVRVCRVSRSLSDAGRKLFDVSRTKKGTSNDADRLRKYLARFGFDWAQISQGQAPPRRSETAPW